MIKHGFRFLCVWIAAWMAFDLNGQQIYLVNTTSDADDGACDAAHCSLREAIRLSDADGQPSLVRFAIPGAGPHIINPTGPFPTVNQNSTQVLGETQTGGAGSVIVNLNFRVLGGIPFWRILGDSFYLSGLGFQNMNFNDPGDHILEFGDATNASDFSTVYNSAFYLDAAASPNTITHSVKLTRGMDITIRKCLFGTDFSKSSIRATRGFVAIGNGLGLGNTLIDSCIFVTQYSCIEARSSQCLISQNIFGALDTSKANNFLDPSYAVTLFDAGIYRVNDNFFFGQKIAGIQTNDLTRPSEYRNNRFYNGTLDLELNGNSNADYTISGTYARNGKDFLNVNTLGGYSLFLERNNISNYTNFYVNNLNPGIAQARHFNNRMTCLSGRAVLLNSNNAPKPPAPSVTSVNRNQITGTGTPNDSVSVYANPATLCPGTACEGGFEIGRTRTDAAGNWVLNVAYPNRHHISAYQYPSNTAARPNIYSEFSNCYTCPGRVRTVFAPVLCAGQTATFRGRTYSSSNPTDSFQVNGDGFSICDSLFIVNVQVAGGSRVENRVNVCFGDTVFLGSLKIYDGNLSDSVSLKTSNGCDSIVVAYGTVRGIFDLNQTICTNDRVTVGNQVFDKDRTSGTAILPGASVFGCDSVVNVQLTVKAFAESDLNVVICKGNTITINGEVFSETKTSGDQTLAGASYNGCDSVIHVKLSVVDPTYNFMLTICPGDSVLIGGAGGRYFSDRNPTGQFVLSNGSYLGCDSIINVNLTVRTEGMGSFRAEICRTDTLILQGQRFSSGRTMGTLRVANGSANGCDSLVSVVLTVLPDAIGTLDTSLCQGGSINIGGNIFDASRPGGSINLPRQSYRGCDSFLTVTVRFIQPRTSNFGPVICSKDSVQVGNQFFSARRPSGSVVISRPASQGCDSIINVSLSFAPPIVPAFSVEPLRCQQANTGALVLNAIGTGSGPYQVSVDGGAPIGFNPGLRITGLGLGNHNLRIIDPIGCDTVLNFLVGDTPPLTLTLNPDTTILLGGSVTMRPTVNFVPSTVSWTPSTFLSCTSCLNPLAKPDQTITYTLKLTDDLGCEISQDITITVKIPESDIYIPNVFSPNGDGVNEFFEVTFRFPDRSMINQMMIFDRWGNLVFERKGSGIGDNVRWDGTYMGRDLQPGVYTYAIQYQAEGEAPQWRRGDVTIAR